MRSVRIDQRTSRSPSAVRASRVRPKRDCSATVPVLDGQQLEVAATEGHDHVPGAEPGVRAALLDVEADGPEPFGGGGEVDDAEDDVAEPGAQAHGKAPRARCVVTTGT